MVAQLLEEAGGPSEPQLTLTLEVRVDVLLGVYGMPGPLTPSPAFPPDAQLRFRAPPSPQAIGSSQTISDCGPARS